MELKALHFERKSPLDVFNTPSGDFRPIQEIFPIFRFMAEASSHRHKKDVKFPGLCKAELCSFIRLTASDICC